MDGPKDLVENGIFDEKSQTTLQVRVMCSLGDNLEQNEVEFQVIYLTGALQFGLTFGFIQNEMIST